MTDNATLEIPLKRPGWFDQTALSLTQPRKILVVHDADGGANVEYQDGTIIFIPMQPDTVIKKVNKYMKRACGRKKKNLRLPSRKRSASYFHNIDPLCA